MAMGCPDCRRFPVVTRGFVGSCPDGRRACFCRSSLCAAGQGDYTFDDGLGHTYYANICGAAAKKCLPKGWVETYQFGVAVQTWGSVPACNLSDPTTLCLDHDGQIPTCCSEDCQVLGVGQPKYTLTDPTNPLAGVNATFQGAPPDDDDPFWCPWNPQTGSQYPRTVTYSLQCDKSVSGALPLVAVQNKTEDCECVVFALLSGAVPALRPCAPAHVVLCLLTPLLRRVSCSYLLVFASMLACPDVTARPRPGPGRGSSGLSGGSVFAIIFFVGLFVYVAVGMLWTYRQEKAWYCPNRFFWSSVGDHVGRGWTFLLFCGKPAESGGSSGSSFLGASNPYAAGVPSAPASSGGFKASGGYNASGGPTAYTDL